MSGKVNLDRWGPHLEAARREGVTLAEYARSHGLSRYTLYAAREMLKGGDHKLAGRRRARVNQGTDVSVSPFAAVTLAPTTQEIGESGSRLRAQLPNGVKLELSWGEAQAGLVLAAIRTLARR